MDDVIERLRRLDPVPEQLAPPPIAELLSQLDRQADGPTPTSPSLRQRRRRSSPVLSVGALVTAASVAIVVVIAIGSLVLLRRDNSAPRHAATGRSVGASREALIQTLGVLRRPQTRVDRSAVSAWPYGRHLSARACLSNANGLPCVDRPLVRKVRVPPLGNQITFLPFASRSSHQFPEGGEGLMIAVHGPHIGYEGGGPVDPSTLKTHGLQLFANVGYGLNRGVIVVPDGVAKVKLRAFRINGHPTANTTVIAAANSPVYENAAGVQIKNQTVERLGLTWANFPGHFSMNAGRGCKGSYTIFSVPDASARMIWQSAAGRTVREQTIEFPLYVSTHHPPPGTPANSTCHTK